MSTMQRPKIEWSGILWATPIVRKKAFNGFIYTVISDNQYWSMRCTFLQYILGGEKLGIETLDAFESSLLVIHALREGDRILSMVHFVQSYSLFEHMRINPLCPVNVRVDSQANRTETRMTVSREGRKRTEPLDVLHGEVGRTKRGPWPSINISNSSNWTVYFIRLQFCAVLGIVLYKRILTTVAMKRDQRMTKMLSCTFWNRDDWRLTSPRALY